MLEPSKALSTIYLLFKLFSENLKDVQWIISRKPNYIFKNISVGSSETIREKIERKFSF